MWRNHLYPRPYSLLSPLLRGEGSYWEAKMATENWVVVSAKYCERVGRSIEIKERRVYPASDFLLTVDNRGQVREHVCSAAIECNMAGIPCSLAYNNPGDGRSL